MTMSINSHSSYFQEAETQKTKWTGFAEHIFYAANYVCIGYFVLAHT